LLYATSFCPICLALELPEWFLCTDSFVKEAPTEWPPQRCEMTFVKIFGALTCLLYGYMIKKTVLSGVRRLFAKCVRFINLFRNSKKAILSMHETLTESRL
jgi:hypothetical protein